MQLLRRSAEDAKRDARQWAASAGDADFTAARVGEEGEGEAGGEEAASVYQSGSIGNATRLIDVVRSAVGANQITAGSPELIATMEQLCRFQQSALSSAAELQATVMPERGERRISIPEGAFSGTVIPPQDQVKAIKSQQICASRERERMIRGIQNMAAADKTDHSAAVRSVLTGFGEEDIQMTAADLEETAGEAGEAGPGMEVDFGASTSFLEAGKAVAARFTLNKRQTIAFLIICRQLDSIQCSGRGDVGQLCEFVGGEGGTGKSRVIEALVELFASKGISNRLLITATSGTAAAQINGITIHSACGFSKDQAAGGGGEHGQGSRRCATAKPGRTICPWPVSYGLAGERPASDRRGEHARSSDATRRERAALPAPRIAAGLWRDPHRPLLRRLPPVPPGPREVDSAPQRGHLVGRRQLLQGRATAPA
ncbi:hypothetical protein BKA56DRAFT_185743 [Ilyonectria sp. MPI-CAGE-AT-0026]|nr:hypothetical protein BKA56DRAFT_185743 [Ilyonectria sp. MPI-CAGE-AT-0026]